MWTVSTIGVVSVLGLVVYSDLSAPSGVVEEVVEVVEVPVIPTPVVVVPEVVVTEELAVVEPVAVVEVPDPVVPEVVPEVVVEVVVSNGFEDESVLVLVGIDAGRDEVKNRDDELLGRAILHKKWDSYREFLGKSIRAALPEVPRGEGLNQFTPIWNEPVLDVAMLRWHTLGRFSESEIGSAVDDSPAGDFIRWFLNDREAMEEFLMTIRPEDASGKVLEFLVYAWSAREDVFEKYYSLALACAVVFDVPMGITHALGESESGGAVQVDPAERYLWYVDKNEKGKLAVSIDRSPAKDLIWVVGAPVVTSELEWSLDKMHLRRGKWGNAYGMIEYLMERAVDGLNPYVEYSFAEILKEGGICGDQTYFTVNTARAQGIPAIGLSGETNLGGHAWAAVKVDPREWDTNIGRIGGVSKGQADNPQTRSQITEQEIQLWNDRLHQSPAVVLSVWRHLWLAEYFDANADEDNQTLAVQLSNRVGRTFLETWNALYSLLAMQTEMVGTPLKPDNLDAWKSFAADMRREFKDNPRMAQLAAKAELEYIFPYGSANDARTAFIRERRRIVSESGEQMDLVAESLKREAEMIVKRGGPEMSEDISQLYDGALRDYGSSITGFKMMAENYFNLVKDNPENAAKAARDIELAFKRVVETGTTDWFRAQTETSIYKMICSYYRVAGDTKKAEALERRYELLMRRAKRGAD